MRFVTNLLRPTYCRMWRRPVLTLMFGLLAASPAVTLWAACDGYYWGSVCANGLSSCSACEYCVAQDCYAACSTQTDYNNCVGAGQQTCSRHYGGVGC